MSNSISVGSIEAILEAEGLMNREVPLMDRYKEAVGMPSIVEAMELQLPIVEDITETLPISHPQGKVYAIRFDLTLGVDNHKKLVIGGLILRAILDGKINTKGDKVLTDAGSFNSAKALKYYTEKLGLGGLHVASRFFPDDVKLSLETDSFKIMKAPQSTDLSIGREREFYGYMVSLFGSSDFRKGHTILGHAKNGGQSMQVFGSQIAQVLNFSPDYTVGGLGIGTGLEGIQIPIKEIYGSKIVIAEHADSPIFFNNYSSEIANVGTKEGHKHEQSFATIDGLPHLVIGPHYDEKNPLLSESSQAKVDGVIQYTEKDRQYMSNYLNDVGVSVGNSSAANLVCATTFANKGSIVLTMIYEPLRSFYVQK